MSNAVVVSRNCILAASCDSQSTLARVGDSTEDDGH